MKCPYCDYPDSKVIDSRPTEDGRAIRRRRECISCGKRFTTYEKVEEVLFMVVKRDGSRESFDRNKILNGIIKACEKRPVTREQMDEVVNNIERGLNNMMEKEISSAFIGEVSWTISRSWTRSPTSASPRSTGSSRTSAPSSPRSKSSWGPRAAASCR